MVHNSPDLDPPLRDQAQAITVKLLDLQVAFTGDRLKAQRSQTIVVPIMSRVQNALRGTLQQTYGPTTTHRQQFQIGQRQFKQVSAELEKVLEKDYQALLDKLDKAGAPWTPGR